MNPRKADNTAALKAAWAAALSAYRAAGDAYHVAAAAYWAAVYRASREADIRAALDNELK